MGPDPKKIKALETRMAKLGIHKYDIEEKFIKSSGRGGQKVNKTSSAVFLKHKVSGLSVKCGKARSQHLNRFLAMRTLVDKIEVHQTGKILPDHISKIRKQKAKRKKRARRKQTTDE